MLGGRTAQAGWPEKFWERAPRAKRGRRVVDFIVREDSGVCLGDGVVVCCCLFRGGFVVSLEEETGQGRGGDEQNRRGTDVDFNCPRSHEKEEVPVHRPL